MATGARAAADCGGAVLENDLLRCVYGRKTFSDGNWTWCITEFTDKRHRVDHARGDQIDGIWQSSDTGTGELTAARVLASEPGRAGVRLTCEQSEIDVRVYDGLPAVRIDYRRPILETVDIGTPGGRESGAYAFHGAERWRPYEPYPASYYNAPECGDPAGAGALAHHGHLVGAVYDPSTGLGFGRVMPVAAINIVKLLSRRGFEWFHRYGVPQAAKEPFAGWVFLVEHGPEDITRVGLALAARPATAALLRRTGAPAGPRRKARP